jgi:hypothetical protein
MLGEYHPEEPIKENQQFNMNEEFFHLGVGGSSAQFNNLCSTLFSLQKLSKNQTVQHYGTSQSKGNLISSCGLMSHQLKDFMQLNTFPHAVAVSLYIKIFNRLSHLPTKRNGKGKTKVPTKKKMIYMFLCVSICTCTT